MMVAPRPSHIPSHSKPDRNIDRWVFLSIGSNLGDPMVNCRRGLDLLRHTDRIDIDAVSPFYWTEPVDYTNQQWFLNAAVKIRTSRSPSELLDVLQTIQTNVGRKPNGIRFGPRILDLDIIFYQDLILKNERLEIPHPRMHKRRFVLQPICDIDRDVWHPVLGKSVFELLNQLDKDDQRIKPCC